MQVPVSMTSTTTTSMGTMPAPSDGGTGSSALTDNGGSSVKVEARRKLTKKISALTA